MSPEKIAIHIYSILSLPEGEMKKRKAAKFLGLFQEDLARRPYTADTKDLYKAVVELYHYLGGQAQKERKYAEALQWYAQSFSIAGRSEEFRREFPDIFLRLAQFFLGLSKYALALHYTKLYKRYNPAMSGFCDDVMSSMTNIQRLSKEGMYRSRAGSE